MLFEPLENRRFLSATLVDGRLVVQGSSLADRVTVSQHTNLRNVIVVDQNGESSYFQLGSVKRIVVYGREGRDTIRIDSSLAGLQLPAYINAGPGSDYVATLDGRDTVFGGRGDDRIDAGAGRDLIHGDDGNDQLYGGFGADTLHGGHGGDQLYGSRVDRVGKRNNESDQAFGEAQSDWFDPRTKWAKTDYQSPASIDLTQTLPEIDANALVAGVPIITGGKLTAASQTIDLHSTDLVVNYGGTTLTYGKALQLITSGTATTAGNGAISITGGAQSGKRLAIVDGAVRAVSIADFTVPAPSSSVLVKFTWLGDANLDGKANGVDYALTDTGFSGGGTTWDQGDFNFYPPTLKSLDGAGWLYDGFSEPNVSSGYQKTTLNTRSTPIDLTWDQVNSMDVGMIGIPRSWRLDEMQVRQGNVVWYRVRTKTAHSVVRTTDRLVGEYRWLAVKKGTTLVMDRDRDVTFSSGIPKHVSLSADLKLLVSGRTDIFSVTDTLHLTNIAKTTIPGIAVQNGVIYFDALQGSYFVKS